MSNNPPTWVFKKIFAVSVKFFDHLLRLTGEKIKKHF